jgi:hypothetical protein
MAGGPKITLRVNDSELVRLIQKTKGKGPVRVVADGVEYGLYQEMGTSRIPAHSFMRPAVEAVRAGFTQAMKGALTMDQVTAVVDKAAFDIERGAKQNAPVDTGALKNSIHVVDGEEFGITFENMRKAAG